MNKLKLAVSNVPNADSDNSPPIFLSVVNDLTAESRALLTDTLSLPEVEPRKKKHLSATA